MRLRLRPYRPSDRAFLRAALIELHDHAVRIDPWEHVTQVDPARFGRERAAHVLRRVRQHRGFITVAEADREPVGVVVGWYRPTSPEEPLMFRPTRWGLVADLVVLRGWRRRGVGSRLLAWALREFRRGGCDIVELHAFAPNSSALRLYRSMGFAPRGFTLAKRVGRSPAAWDTRPGPWRAPRSAARPGR